MKRKFWSGDKLTKPTGRHDDCILVAGSNVQGWSGAGTAKLAVDHWGAKYGVSRGLTGRAYLLPTKSLRAGWVEKQTGVKYHSSGNRSLSPEQITENIAEMYCVIEKMSDKLFIIPYINNGRNLNGYTFQELVQMFLAAGEIPVNVVFHESWKGVFQSE